MTATVRVLDTFRPAYLSLWQSGELAGRVERALSKLGDCVVCPRDCHVDRLADKFAVCRSGRYVRVSSYFPYFGEEDCLRGTRGSGTIFFSGCNLRCVFWSCCPAMGTAARYPLYSENYQPGVLSRSEPYHKRS